MEELEGIKLFPCAEKLDRLPRHGTDRKDGSSSSIAFNLCEDDAGQTDLLIKPARHVDGILSGHRIGNEQDLLRHHGALHRNQLRHQVLIDVQPAPGIQEDEVIALLITADHSLLTDSHDIGSRRVRLINAKYVDAEIPSETGQLISRCRS